MRYFLTLLLFAHPVFAQDWALRDTDQILSKEQISEAVVGKTLTFYDNGQSRFSTEGQYTYTYDGGGASLGRYRIEPQGVICVEFENGWSRCDKFVRANDHLVLLTEKGERYPVRP